MDKVVDRKRIDKRILIGGAGGLALILILAFWLFAPRAGSQSVAMDRLTISTVDKGVFEDFLPLRARVTPLVTVYLDAVEGGRVEKEGSSRTAPRSPKASYWRSFPMPNCNCRRSRSRPRSSSS